MRTATLVSAAALVVVGPLALAQEPPAQGIVCAHEGQTEEEAHFASSSSLLVDVDDGPDVRALLVFVRFRDDPIDPDWWPGTGASRELPVYAESILAPDAASITQSDSSLSRYFYEQSKTSQTGPAQLRVYGDIYPRNGQNQPETYVTKHDNSYYHSASGRGYGYLTEEILDSLVTVPGFDIGDYDANADSVLDHLFLVIRSEELGISRGGPIQYSGCSWLDSTNCSDDPDPLEGRPAPYLRYESPSRSLDASLPDSVTVDWYESGSHNFSHNPANVVHLPYHVTLLAHEWGHELWEEKFNHVAPVTGMYGNAVPANAPSRYGYALMAGAPYADVNGDLAISPHERALLGWLDPVQLGPGNNGHTVSLGDLYSTTDAATLTTPKGTVYLANRQRIGWFDQLHQQEDKPHPYDDVYRGLMDTGLLAQFSTADHNLDTLPADNTLNGGDWFEGDPNNPNVWEGDLHGPDSRRQLTPWTMPNVNGCNGYATDPLCDDLDFANDPIWQAVDDIRYTGAADSSMAFTYYSDYRSAPEVVVRADSWMGQETAMSSPSGGTSYRFESLVRVTNGATLRVWEGTTIEFGGGLTVEEGAEFVCEPGSTCVVEGDVLVEGAGSTITSEVGATVRFQGGGGAVSATDGGSIANRGGTYEFADGRDYSASSSSAPTVAEQGALFKLSAGSSFWLGSPVDWTGTGADLIRFERLDPNQRWGSVELRAPGNELRHVVLDGGYDNVYVRSRDNRFYDVTSRNGYRNLYTNTVYGSSTPSRVDAYRSAFEDATGYGVYSYNGDVNLYDSAVRGSAYNGVRAYYGKVALSHSAVTGNGSPSYDGVYVSTGGDFRAYYGTANRVVGNGRHEVRTYGSGRAYLYGGDNTVCDPDDPGATGKYVYEGGTYAVDARYNYWGQSVDPSMFYGSVTYSPWESSPYPSAGDCSVSGTLMATSAGPSDGVTAGPDTAASLTTTSEAPEDGGVHHELGRGLNDLRTRILAARSAFAENAAPALLAELYRLQRLDAEDELGEAAATMAVVEAVRQAPVVPGPSRDLAERAELVALDDAMGRFDLDLAQTIVDTRSDRVTSEAGRAELVAAQIELLRRKGHSGQAFALLSASEDLLGAEEVDAVRWDLERETGDVAPSAGVPATAVAQGTAVVEGAGEYETALLAPHPNPTPGAVTVPLTLAGPADVRVSVYDALGREVAVLADGPLGAGRHPLAFDGGSLPVGVYVVQAVVEGGGAAAESFVRRLTVVR